MVDNRHARIPPTREKFFIPNGGSTNAEQGAHVGYSITGDGNEVYIEGFVPHDYHGFYEAKLVFIAGAALTPMTIRVSSDYCAENEVSNHQTQGPFDFSINTGATSLHELDISDLVNGDAITQAIERGDYIGIKVERVAGQNTNALILGVRLRYKVYKHK